MKHEYRMVMWNKEKLKPKSVKEREREREKENYRKKESSMNIEPKVVERDSFKYER